LIRTKMLSSFESKFPKTVEQFQLRQGLLESTAASTDETPTWTLDTLETVFRESNDSSKEAIARISPREPLFRPNKRDLSQMDGSDRDAFDKKGRRVSGAASGFGSAARDGTSRSPCFLCGALGHFQKDCPKKGDPKPRLADRDRGGADATATSVELFEVLEYQRDTQSQFHSETYCGYHVSDSHSIANCTTVQEHRRNGHEWCNSCASTTHDTPDCRGRRSKQGGGREKPKITSSSWGQHGWQ
jgi:hypothetical protein